MPEPEGRHRDQVHRRVRGRRRVLRDRVLRRRVRRDQAVLRVLSVSFECPTGCSCLD